MVDGRYWVSRWEPYVWQNPDTPILDLYTKILVLTKVQQFSWVELQPLYHSIQRNSFLTSPSVNTGGLEVRPSVRRYDKWHGEPDSYCIVWNVTVMASLLNCVYYGNKTSTKKKAKKPVNSTTIWRIRSATGKVGEYMCMKMLNQCISVFIVGWPRARLRWPNTVFKCLCLIHHYFSPIYAWVPVIRKVNHTRVYCRILARVCAVAIATGLVNNRT